MKRIYLIGALGILGLLSATSCKKYDCVCSVTFYDGNGSYVSSTTESHTVKARGILRAVSKCSEYSEYSTNIDKSCSIN